MIPVTKKSDFQSDEKVVPAVANLIAPQIVCRMNISAALPARAVFLFLEAIPTNPAEDFQVEAQVEFYRNSALVYSFPASIASNAAAAGIVTKSQLTAFGNVGTGTIENLQVVLSAPLAGGTASTALTPQKLNLDADEVLLRIIGSKNTGNSFAAWRALLAVRSSDVAV
jgi:hypothetical protein